jgi:hypothetical protein
MILDRTALDASLPAPAAVIGHEIGDGAIGHEALVAYLRALADASPLVTLTPYAQTHEGRTLHYLTITSEANHARLDTIKESNGKLADPRKLGSVQEADRIIDALPGVAWMAYCIHGDELSSTDAAVLLAYRLVAGTDEASQRLRQDLVIHIDPLMNPDGRERYLGQLTHLTGKIANPDYQAMQHRGLWSGGRGNHYLSDLNRDWLMQVHPETRGRAAAILGWNPHLVVDSHEMGGLSTYLFDPPREPLNPELSAANMEWRRRFSADQARAFDRYGWSYYTQEWYEEWYPGFTNAWASLVGAVGLLYEQAGVQATSVKQRSGGVLSYSEAVHHHFVSSMANLETLRTHRREILRDFFEDRRRAVSEREGDLQAFLVPPPADRCKLDRFVTLLERQGIESTIATEPLQAHDVVSIWAEKTDSMTFPAGTLMVDAAQPARRLLLAILDFDPHMTATFLNEEREQLVRRKGSRIYDITAWNLAMAYGLEAFWAGGTTESSSRPYEVRPRGFDGMPAGYGFLINGADGDSHRAIVRLLDRDCKVRVAMKPFSMAGVSFAPGSALLRNHENPDDLPRRISEAVADLSVDVLGVDTALSDDGPDLGGGRFRLLAQPRVALASQWPTATTSFGATWHLLDARIGLRTSPVNIQRLGRVDLRAYNVLVLPNVWDAGGPEAVLNEPVRKKLRAWVEAGGTLIAMGRSAAFLADEKRGLSAVRRKRNVLDKLDVYQDGILRERAAKNIDVDPESVWTRPAIAAKSRMDTAANTGPSQERDKKDDLEALKREDAWQRLFRPIGAILAARVDPQHWLCFGACDPPHRGLPVLISGDVAYMSTHPVATPVRLADSAELRLSGLLWPEARTRLAETAYATVERVGHGQVILFASDPFFRGYFEGSGRLLMNAIILGPGLGTDQPVPW